MKKKRLQELVQCAVPGVLGVFLTGWLFFDFSPIAIILLPYIPFSFIKEKKKQEETKRWRLNLAFQDALIYLQNALAAGYSAEGGLKETVGGMELLYGANHPITVEFGRMAAQLSVGENMETVLSEFGARSKIEDIIQFAEIFAVVKRTGGNLVQVIRQTGSVLQEKIELRRELHAAVAAKQTEFQIMCFIPHGILFYLKMFAPEMSISLYHNFFGICFMWIMLAAYLGLRCLGDALIAAGMKV